MMNDLGVDPRRLELLLELSRLGSMREVGESMHVTTSTVSQQIAALAQEAGTPLTEPHGRRVRLTPAGRRLAGHAVTILAALEAARLDLDPTAPPAGTVRVAAFATAVRESVLPVVRLLAERHPAVLLVVHEHEPDEALGLLADDAVDLALTYDYNVAPARFDRTLVTQPLGLRQLGLGAPSVQGRVAGTALEVFRRFADHDWIVNSRNSADEEAIRTVASLAGFQPRITHRVDSLELVQDMILAGLGVGLLAAGRPVRRGVVLRTLDQPAVTQRPFAVTRRGRSAWPPLALVLQLLGEISGLTARRINGELRASRPMAGQELVCGGGKPPHVRSLPGAAVADVVHDLGDGGVVVGELGEQRGLVQGDGLPERGRCLPGESAHGAGLQRAGDLVGAEPGRLADAPLRRPAGAGGEQRVCLLRGGQAFAVVVGGVHVEELAGLVALPLGGQVVGDLGVAQLLGGREPPVPLDHPIPAGPVWGDPQRGEDAELGDGVEERSSGSSVSLAVQARSKLSRARISAA
jgi:DNA-binding transcriptional LysR family regulator